MYFSDIIPQEQSEWWFYEKNVIDESTICKIENYLEGKELISNREMNDVYDKNMYLKQKSTKHFVCVFS